MTGEDVKNRLLQGYMVTLRHSSIRPDLPKLLDEIKEMDIQYYDYFMLTTDGSNPSFYRDGFMDRLIEIAIKKGVPPIDAYLMATFNPAKYYHLEHLHGLIATGRVANINFIENERNPRPVSVLAKGQWIVKDGKVVSEEKDISWEEFGYAPMHLDWSLKKHDLQFSMPFGMHMENAVITKPYTIHLDLDRDEIAEDLDECF